MNGTRKNKAQYATLIERIDNAIECGTIDVFWECKPHAEDSVSITDGELARIMMILFPEEFPEKPPPHPEPTPVPPGTPRKVAEMARRLKMGLSLFNPLDARDCSTAKGVPSRNGQGSRSDLQPRIE